MNEGCYYWAVICKNHRFHNKQNTLFGHKIPLGETDSYSSLPALDRRFTVRCDDCGQEYSYKPADVVRIQLESVDFYVPHPLFMSDSVKQPDDSPKKKQNGTGNFDQKANTDSGAFHGSGVVNRSDQFFRLTSLAVRTQHRIRRSLRYALDVADRERRLVWEYRKPMGTVANRLRGHVLDSSRTLYRLAPVLGSSIERRSKRLTNTLQLAYRRLDGTARELRDTVRGRWAKKDSTIQFTCCVCRKKIEKADPDRHSLQVRKVGAASSEMVWVHGACLRQIIPVFGEETRGAS